VRPLEKAHAGLLLADDGPTAPIPPPGRLRIDAGADTGTYTPEATAEAAPVTGHPSWSRNAMDRRFRQSAEPCQALTMSASIPAGRGHPVPVRRRPQDPARQGRRASEDRRRDRHRNASARIDGLRSSLSLLAIVALIALFATRRIPAQQPTGSPASESMT